MTETELETALREEWPEAATDDVKSFIETWLKFMYSIYWIVILQLGAIGVILTCMYFL